MNLPIGTRPTPEHPTQKSLDLLGAGLVLCFNAKLGRYEVWMRELKELPRLDGLIGHETRVDYGFIVRVTNPDGVGFAEPGPWLLNVLRARDSRHRPVKEAAEEAMRDLKAAEAAEAAERDRRESALVEEIALDNIPLWKQESDPHLTGKRYTEWNPEPIHIPTAKTPMEAA